MRGQVLSFQEILGPMYEYFTVENLSTHQDRLRIYGDFEMGTQLYAAGMNCVWC